MAACQILARYTEFAVSLGTTGKNDRVVAGQQFLHADVTSHGDVAQVSELRCFGDPLINLYRLLELGMIRRDATAYQSKRRGQPLEHVDQDQRFGFEQRLGGVEATRSAANNGYPQRVLLCPEVAHAKGFREASAARLVRSCQNPNSFCLSSAPG